MGKKGEIQTKYPPEVKLEAVRLYLEEGLSYEQVATKLGIVNQGNLKRWIQKYRKGERYFLPKLPKKPRSYPSALKLEAIRLHEEDNLSYDEIMSKLGIVSKSKLRIWICQYQNGRRDFTDQRGRKSKGRPRNNPNDTAERQKNNQQLEKKIKRLEMENALLKKVWAELRGW